MGTPFRIPKKKHQSESSRIHMTSPLSRVQDGVTSKASWSGTFNGRRPQEKSCVPGKEEPRPGPTGAGRWRPKRASDTLCVREADDDMPAVKKQWGCGPVETRLSQSEDEEETQPASPSSEPRKPRAAVCLAGKSATPTPPNTQAEESKKDIHKPRPSFEAPVRTTGAALAVPVRKVSSDRPYPTKKLHLQLSYKTYQRIKSRCMETIVLSSDDEDEREECGRRGGPGGESKKSSQDSCAGPQGSSSTEMTPVVMELAFTTLHLGRTQTHANGPITITEECISIPLKGADGEGEAAVTMVPSELYSYGVWDGAPARDAALLTDSTEPSPSLLFFSVSDAQASLLQKELSLIHTTHTLGKPCPFVLVLLADWLDDLRRATLASLMDLMSLRCGRASLTTPLSWDEGLRKLRSHPSGTHLLTLLDHRGHAPSPAQHTEGNEDKEEGLCKTRKGRTGLEGGVSDVTSTRHASLRSHTRLQPLPRRLIQYPPPPSKGGITVTTEDLECLRDEEFLNDVIIDFYLKYLHLEWAERGVAERTHIFSSFFYKQLTRRSNSSEEEAGGTAQYRRHRRVRTWTRHVDIFTKDFLFIPVNQEAHWYLVVICFPGLLKPESVLTRCPALVEGSKATSKLQPHASAGPANHCRGRQQTGNTDVSKGRLTPGALASSDPPDCTALTCQKEKVTRRPCILIMDSLKLSYHYGIYTLLREYLQVEWEVRRGTPRTFTDDVIKGSHCKVPLQDNSSDCGLYLLQYVESFLQNPVVHFELPLRLERWFPRQQVRRKREELRELVLRLYRQQGGAELSSS